MSAARCKTEVKLSETSANGAVYYTNYYAWYELVQYKFLSENGCSYDELSKNGTEIVLTEMNTRCFAPARLGDVIIADMEIVSSDALRLTVDFTLTREKDSTLIARSRAVYICVDKSFKPVLISRALPKLYAAIQKECGETN